MYEFPLTDKAVTDEEMAFFKAIPADWYEQVDGNVEAPTGWFGLLEIDEQFRENWEQDAEEGVGISMPESIQLGLYLVTIDNDGLIWAEQGDTRHATSTEFTHKCDVFRAWDDEDNE